MDTQANSKPGLHPIIWIAAVAIILFSAVGIGKQMGWFSPAAPEAVVSEAKPKVNATEKAKTPQKSASVSKPTAKEPVRKSSPAVKEYESEKNSAANRYPPTTRAALSCTDCGVINAVRVVEVPVAASGVGAVAGGVVGGVLGNQVGKGKGKDVATVAGAVIGGIAGHQIEKKVRTEKHYEIDVSMADGSTRTISQPTQPTWQAGDRVTVRDGVINTRSNSNSDYQTL